jgi:hypothetical protein
MKRRFPMRCPSCEADSVYLSRFRSFKEAFLANVLPLEFRRCHACNRRSLRPSLQWQKLLGSAGIMVLMYLLVYTILVFMKVIR